MNYLILKSVVESTIAHFNCRNCGNHVGDKDVRVIGLTGNAIDLEVRCPICNADGAVKAEIGMMGQNGLPGDQVPPTPETAKELLENLEKMLASNKANASGTSESIKDEDIMELRKKLKQPLSAEDLFNL